MKIAVYSPKDIPISLRKYTEYVSRHLGLLDVECFFFSECESIPDHCDVYWDPRAADGTVAFDKLRKDARKELLQSSRTIIITQHSAVAFSTPPWEYYPTFRWFLGASKRNLLSWLFWKRFNNYSRIITVSEYAKWEITRYLPIPRNKVSIIYHGVDHSLFVQKKSDRQIERYFLHISSYQPIKNVERLIEAYSSIELSDKPKLVLIVPGYKKSVSNENIRIIDEPLEHDDIVEFYCHATAFFFPSLVETFGLPILEAMACGCPVVTSNSTACKEIAGDGALLVNPRSVTEIKNAMVSLHLNEDLRGVLIERGLKRAAEFSWKKSAKEHFMLFREILRQGL